jgi:tetratricopeptide (TPR) repeat protein
MLIASAMVAGCGNQVQGGPLAPRRGAAADRFSVSTDALIARDQHRLRERPGDWAAVDELASAYLQKVREVGDPSYYPKAEALLTSSLRHDSKDVVAITLMGTLQLARHQFASALDWGEKAHSLDSYAANPLGVMSDAQLQLGRYPDAISSLQQMIDLRPDLSSYSRVSYVRELYGDIPGAVKAMQMAIAAGGPVPENEAYTEVLLGTLYFNSGRLKEAEAEYQHALVDFPGYVQAVAGIAAIRGAQRRYDQAIRFYRQAIDIYPIPQYVIALGDVYLASGDARRASETYDLAAAEQRLYQANGVDLDQELALFDADHQRELGTALAAARRATHDRPNVITDDSLAWTLYQAGDYHAAEAASVLARRLGTRDALIYFHAGMIEANLGETALARSDLEQALSINPYFSVLWAPVARMTLKRLGRR